MDIRKKRNIFIMLAVLSAAAAVFSGSASERAWGSVSGETEILLVNFGGTASENVFGISGWNTVIKDVYTGYRAYGPRGTVITVGSAAAYDYQGLTGPSRVFAAGERIAVTWYNNSDTSITFAPKISFDDPDRRVTGTAGTWYSMSSTVAGPRETAQSFFEFGADSEGTYGIVNVNVNYANHEILICDRIELIIPGTDTEPPSAPQNLRAEIIFGLHILLIWDTSSDSTAVAGYRIYSGDGIETGDTADTQYMIADAGPGTHTYKVSAYDVPGNESELSALTVTVESGEALLLADFGGTASENVFGISGWNTVIRDVYTGYRSCGPGGTVITVGSEAGYNYQGVTGPSRAFAEGDRIVVTWYNNSDISVTFAPKISFDDPDRRISGTPGMWHSMSSVTAGPGESAQSFFEFDEGSQETYGIVNVNVNYANHEILICDRIDLVIPGTDTEPPSVPPNLGAVQTPVISGYLISLSWDAASGSAGVGYYEIFRDGIFLAEVPDTEYGDPDVLPGTSYTYTVRACDAAGNCSEQSSAVSVTTPDIFPGETTVIGAEGGVVTGPGGIRAVVPAGAVPDGTFIRLGTIAEPSGEEALPEGFCYIAGIYLEMKDASGNNVTAAEELKLSVPVPGIWDSAECGCDISGFPEDQPECCELSPDCEYPPLVLRGIRVFEGTPNGKAAYALNNTARINNGRIETASPPFPGARAAGPYMFVKPMFPIGFFVATPSGYFGAALAGVSSCFGETFTDPLYNMSAPIFVIPENREFTVKIYNADSSTAAEKKYSGLTLPSLMFFIRN